MRVARDGSALPLSFAQQRLWLVDRMEPGSPAYNMAYALRLHGELDAAALRASLDALVRRHETLRTTCAGSPRRWPTTPRSTRSPTTARRPADRIG